MKIRSRKAGGRELWANNCVQATPGCAFLLSLAQVAGAPEHDVSAHT
jgi:hypothetical protein